MAIEKVVQLDIKLTESKLKIKKLNTDLVKLDKTTLEYKETLRRLKKEETKLANNKKLLINENRELSKSNETLSKSTKKVGKNSGIAQSAAQELGRTVSDLPFGVRGVANNLSQLGSLFTGLATQTGGFINGLKALAGTLVGPLGLLVAFQAITAFIQTDFFDALISGGQAQKELNDLNKRSTEIAGDNLTRFKALTDVLLDQNATQEELRKATQLLNKEFTDFDTTLVKNAETYEEAQKVVENYTKAIIQQAKSEAALELIKEKQTEILKLENERQEEIIKAGFKNQEEINNEFIARQQKIEQQKEKDRNTRRATGTERDLQFSAIRLKRIKELNKEEIEDLEKSIDRLSELGDIRAVVLRGAKDDKKSKDNQSLTETTKRETTAGVEIVDPEITRAQQLAKIKEDLRQKELADIQRTELEKLMIERNSFEARLQALNVSELERSVLLQSFDDKIQAIRQKELDNEQRIIDAKKTLQLQLVDTVGGTIGRLGQLFEQGTAASKAAALADVIIGTGVGFINALDIAQKGAKGTGPAAPFTFPIFYATQIASVLGAVGQAKNILSKVQGGGGSAATSSAPRGASFGASAQPQAPSFNLVGQGGFNQLAQSLQQNREPIQAFVVSNNVTNQQELDRNIERTATL